MQEKLLNSKKKILKRVAALVSLFLLIPYFSTSARAETKSVDISSDLGITLETKCVETPTLTGIYSLGKPANTYFPGKDFSLLDNVSTGKVANYNIKISLNSKGNQLYDLDELYIQSVADPREDGTGKFLGYWINTNGDPKDTTDDGKNTIVNGYNSKMYSKPFSSSSKIKSNSCLDTFITVTLPASGFYWKTKVMPKIQVVAVKDGIKKVSSPFDLPTLKLSTSGNLVSTLKSSNSIEYKTIDGKKGFTAPFTVTTEKENIISISKILDDPKYELITYSIKIDALINGKNFMLNTDNFKIGNIDNGKLVSSKYNNGVLTLVVKQLSPGPSLSFTVTPFIPFNMNTSSITAVEVKGSWNTKIPEITNFQNQYLFNQCACGSICSKNIFNTPNTDGVVTVKYLEEGSNKELSHDVTIIGAVGTEYYTVAKYIYGYQLTKVPENANGTFKKEPQTVTYYYKHRQSVVNVKYVEEKTLKSLVPDEVLTGYVGDKYETSAKNIPGYDFVRASINAKGVFLELPQTVIYYYRKAVPCVSTVTVKHLEQGSNKELAPHENLNGTIGEEYSTTSKAIYGYELVETPENANGTFKEEPQTVTYYYKHLKGTVTVKYLDKNSNKPIAPNEVLAGYVGDKYETSAKKVKGYSLVQTPYNANGTFATENKDVIYYYSKDSTVPVPDDNNTRNNTPKTGDPNNLISYIIIASASLIVLAGITIKRKSLKKF